LRYSFHKANVAIIISFNIYILVLGAFLLKARHALALIQKSRAAMTTWKYFKASKLHFFKTFLKFY